MEIYEILEELKKKVKSKDVYYADTKIKNLFIELIKSAAKLFPEKSKLLLELKNKTVDRNHGPYGDDILEACKIIGGFFGKKVTKAFLAHDELINQARLALRQGQDAFVIHLCDAAIEAFLKETFDVPSTIAGVGTVKFLSECIILNVPQGMELYMQEVKNKVSQMDNQIKHKAYVPSRLDAINALKATEEFYIRKDRFKNLTSDEIKKIQIGIGVVAK